MATVDRVGRAISRLPGGFALTTVDGLVDWARSRSLWSMPMGTACCAIELMTTSFSKFDFDRHGCFPRPDPRHCDVMIVAGTISRKMAPAIKRLYEQMPDPKWVIAMGNCAVSGGIFHYDSYSAVRGVDEIIPVDVYITGCPPRCEALEDSLFQLRELIKMESLAPGVRHERPLILPLPGDISIGARPCGEGEPSKKPTAEASAEDSPAEGGEGE